MRAKGLRLLTATQAFLLVASLFLPALAAAATISTDLWVYQDGDTVTVTGVEYGANEVVDFVTTDPLGAVVDSGSAPTDELGNVTYAFVLTATVDGIYDVVGTGETSGLSASTQFDPGSVSVGAALTAAVHNVAQGSGTSGFDVTVSGLYSCSSSCTVGTGSVSVELYLSDGGPGLGTYFGSPGSHTTLRTLAATLASGTWSTTYNFRTTPTGAEIAVPPDGKFDVSANFTFTGSGSPKSGVGNDYSTADNTAPSVSMTSAAPAFTASSPIHVTVTFSEPVTGFVVGDIAVGNATKSAFSGSGANYSFDLTPLGQGAVTADIAAGVANDLATLSANSTTVPGNPNTAAAQFTRTYDTVAPGRPSLTGSTPPSPSTNNTPTINGTAEAGATVRLYKNSGCTGSHDDGTADGSGNFAVPVTVGVNSANTFYGTATDAAGLTSLCSLTFVTYVSDNAGPITTILSNPPSSTTSTAAVFTFSGNDGGGPSATGVAGFYCQLDSAGYSPCTSGYDFGPVGVGGHTFDVYAVDVVGNAGAPDSYSWTVLPSDSTGPVISISTSAVAGLSGWYNVASSGTSGIDVDVSATDVSGVSVFTCSVDGGLPAAYNPAGDTIHLGDGTHTVSCYAEDTLGNPTTSGTFTYKVDQTAPTINDDGPTPAAPDGLNNWYVTAVSNAFSASDSGSGLDAACTLAFPKSVSTGLAEGSAVHVASGACSDLAGNTNSGINSADFAIDLTAPTITDLGPTTSPNAAFWYKTAVTNRFQASDATSGLDAVCLVAFSAFGHIESMTTTTEGASVHVASDGCSDLAGNTNAGIDSADFKIDLTNPYNLAFVGGGLIDGGLYYWGFVPLGPSSCTAQDDLSGFKSCSLSPYSDAIGSHTITATALDNADNSATKDLNYTVNAWTLKGFYQPVDMANLNTVKNGSTVPLKFEIFAGPTELKSTSYVKSFKQQQVSCALLSDLLADPVDVTTTGGTTLRFDTTGDQFIQNWQTPKSPNTCWVVTMTTQDGSSLFASFKLR